MISVLGSIRIQSRFKHFGSRIFGIPLDEMSGAARSVEVPSTVSLSSGKSRGSITTSLQTSRCISALRSLRALCRMATYPPLAHINVWSTELTVPHQNVFGVLGIFHPYLRQIASLNSCLFKQKPWLFSGKAVSQDPDPFSSLRIRHLFR